MKTPQRLLLGQRRAGKKRVTQVLLAVVAVFAVREDKFYTFCNRGIILVN